MATKAFVLDASVVLAAMLGELSPEESDVWLVGSCISAVNLSETIAKFVERGYSPDDIEQNIGAMKFDVRPFDRAQAERAGLLRAATLRRGLSLGDRACLALAAELGRAAVTADKAWAGLDIDIPIEFIR